MSQLIPVINKSYLYIWDLLPSYVSTTTLSVNSGYCRDENNIIDIELTDAVTLDTSVVGLNGIDTGSLSASTQYTIWVIADSAGQNETGVILSLAANDSPTLPFGYDSVRKIGHAFTNGSSHFLNFYTTGLNSTRTFYYDSAQLLLNGGSATSPTDVDLGIDEVVSGPNIVHLIYSYTPSNASNEAHLKPSGSSGTVIPVINTSGTNDVKNVMYVMSNVSESNGVQYDVDSGDTLSLWLLSFEFNV
jgi:hypothetical protein